MGVRRILKEGRMFAKANNIKKEVVLFDRGNQWPVARFYAFNQIRKDNFLYHLFFRKSPVRFHVKGPLLSTMVNSFSLNDQHEASHSVITLALVVDGALINLVQKQFILLFSTWWKRKMLYKKCELLFHAAGYLSIYLHICGIPMYAFRVACIYHAFYTGMTACLVILCTFYHQNHYHDYQHSSLFARLISFAL